MKKIVKFIFMLVPAVCFALAVYYLTDYAYSKLLETNAAFNMLISSADTIEREADAKLNESLEEEFIVIDNEPEIITKSDETIPTINYGSRWATLNIDGWNTKDIPVYFGDTDDILSKGAGQWNSSFFCGLGKNCVLSAHFMTWFYEIEDTEIGDEVTMQTIYGTYKYEVTDKFIFNQSDSSALTADYGGDTLLIYTCYPRSNGVNLTNQRIALVCSLTKGVLYENKYQ